MCIVSVSLHAGANDDLEKQIAFANQKCSDFFVMMKKDKEQALLLPPYEFEVCCLPVECTTLTQIRVAADFGRPQCICNLTLCLLGGNQAQIWRHCDLQSLCQVQWG